MRDRAYRRAKYDTRKAKFTRVVKSRCPELDDLVTPKFIGRLATTHKPCSCYMCGNPRKYFKQDTIQELRESQDDVEQGVEDYSEDYHSMPEDCFDDDLIKFLIDYRVK